MLCYIKSMKTFETLAKFDATSWSLPEGVDGEVVIYQKDAVELTTKYAGMWLIINKELFYISGATPNDDYITLKIQPPIYAFYRQVLYDGSTTFGTLIANILNNDFGTNCPDTAYRMSYMRVVNSDTTECSIETDEYGYIIPCDIFDDALYSGVSIDFTYSGDTLLVTVSAANYSIQNILFNDGKNTIESEAYDQSFVAKVTVIHLLGDDTYETIDYYLSTDNEVSTEPPENRAIGSWVYANANEDENPEEIALGIFNDNTSDHKIEFYSPIKMELYQRIRIRLRGTIFYSMVTARLLYSSDSRYYYKCGNLFTTLTEKIDANEQETSSEIAALKKQIVGNQNGS